MGATEEQMKLVAGSGIDHVAYILILYSLAFLMFLFVNILITIYDRTANADLLAAKRRQRDAADAAESEAGAARIGGLASTENLQVRDAEEFELSELSEDEEDEEHSSRKNLLKQGAINGQEGASLMNGNGQAHH